MKAPSHQLFADILVLCSKALNTLLSDGAAADSVSVRNNAVAIVTTTLQSGCQQRQRLSSDHAPLARLSLLWIYAHASGTAPAPRYRPL